MTLMLSDMKVTERHQAGDALLAEPLYFIHTVGLYIIISVPRLGITVIWDKHTRVTIQLEPQWRVRSHICYNIILIFSPHMMNDTGLLCFSKLLVVKAALLFLHSLGAVVCKHNCSNWLCFGIDCFSIIPNFHISCEHTNCFLLKFCCIMPG